ncbi:hypothetical protein ACIOHS_47470 [Streptomyces sp. NPDC088253]|uniref:hypothetical protein n=1 Tax=Streptomyces sp. NPDC088253 TaxID=3365846 RepID=UPI003800C0B1
MKAQNVELKGRVTDPDATIEEPTEFTNLALPQLAAQLKACHWPFVIHRRRPLDGELSGRQR